MIKIVYETIRSFFQITNSKTLICKKTHKNLLRKRGKREGKLEEWFYFYS